MFFSYHCDEKSLKDKAFLKGQLEADKVPASFEQLVRDWKVKQGLKVIDGDQVYSLELTPELQGRHNSDPDLQDNIRSFIEDYIPEGPMRNYLMAYGHQGGFLNAGRFQMQMHFMLEQTKVNWGNEHSIFKLLPDGSIEYTESVDIVSMDDDMGITIEPEKDKIATITTEETWKRSRKAERVDKPEVAKKRSPVF